MERTEQNDYIVIKGLVAMAEKKLKLANANTSNKTAHTEAQFLIYAASAIHDTMRKGDDTTDGTDEAGGTPGGT